MEAITKFELIEQLARKNPRLSLNEVDESVRTILNAMTSAMAGGSRVEIRGFGTFSLSYRAERVGRNPKTGVSVVVPPKYEPHFKPGKEMRERVRASVQDGE